MGTVKSNTILNAEQFVSKRQQELLHVKHAVKLTETRVFWFWFWFVNQQDSLTNMFADVIGVV